MDGNARAADPAAYRMKTRIGGYHSYGMNSEIDFWRIVMNLNEQRRFLKVDELASWLGVPVSWVYSRTCVSAADRIPHFKFGKYLRFTVESTEFRDWLKSCSTNDQGGL